MNICYSYGYGDNSFGHEKCEMGWRWEGGGGGKSPPGVISTPLCEVGGWYPPLMHHFYLSKEVDIPPFDIFLKKMRDLFFCFENDFFQ